MAGTGSRSTLSMPASIPSPSRPAKGGRPARSVCSVDASDHWSAGAPAWRDSRTSGRRVHRGQPLGRRRDLSCHHRHPEVGQGRFPEAGHEDVGRLYVPVHDALFRGQLQNAAHFHPDADHVADWQHPGPGQPVGQRPARAVLHLDVAPAVGEEPAGEDRDHVGMTGQPARQRQLPLEAPAGSFVSRGHGEHLHRYDPVEGLLAGAIDHTRTARRDRHRLATTNGGQRISRRFPPPGRHTAIMPQGRRAAPGGRSMPSIPVSAPLPKCRARTARGHLAGHR